MEEAGLYTGGAVKFGYHLVDSGLINKKNQPIKKYKRLMNLRRKWFI